MRRSDALVVSVGALVLLTGCAGASQDAVAAVASAFENPDGDPHQRCELLSPATLGAFEASRAAPCADAIDGVPLTGSELTAVEVWGGNAQVRLADDVVFLTETGAGWKVTAAACEPRGEAPYDCEVDGP